MAPQLLQTEALDADGDPTLEHSVRKHQRAEGVHAEISNRPVDARDSLARTEERRVYQLQNVGSHCHITRNDLRGIRQRRVRLPNTGKYFLKRLRRTWQ
jgi:hypothetical protein